MNTEPTKNLMQTESVREMLRHPMATEQLKRVASRMIEPGRMLRTITMSFRDNPLLADCEPMSFLGSLMTCASLGLMPNTPLGEAYLVPFRNGSLSRKLNRDVYEVTVIIGYRGWIKLARRSGGLVAIHADVATKEEYQEEFFDWNQGSQAFLKHKAVHPDGEPMWVYAHAQLKDGEAFVVWPYEKVLAHRDRFSQAYRRALAAAKDKKKAWMLEQTPWVAHEYAMARKTMVLQLCRWLDLTVEAESAMAIDDGPRLDYGSFALEGSVKPGDIPEPLTEAEADADEAEDAEEVETAPAEEKKPQSAPKQETAKKAQPAKPKEAPKAEPKAEPAKGKADKPAPAKKAPAKPKRDDADPQLFDDEPPATDGEDPFDPVANQIIGEIDEAATAESVSAVLAIWETDLQRMEKQSPANYKRVDEAAQAATDRLNRGDE